jgi:hypothetical protein
MLQLRRITDKVLNRGTAAADQLRDSLPEMRQRGNELARSAYDRSSEVSRMAYDYAMNHRKATTAVLLGTGIAAALFWVVNRNGGYQAMRRKVLQRVRGSASNRARSRRRVANTAE